MLCYRGIRCRRVSVRQSVRLAVTSRDADIVPQEAQLPQSNRATRYVSKLVRYVLKVV